MSSKGGLVELPAVMKQKVPAFAHRQSANPKHQKLQTASTSALPAKLLEQKANDYNVHAENLIETIDKDIAQLGL